MFDSIFHNVMSESKELQEMRANIDILLMLVRIKECGRDVESNVINFSIFHSLSFLEHKCP